MLRAIRDEHEIIPLIEKWRELSKLKSTYLDSLPALISPDTGRLHTTFNQAATTTGRLSSTEPEPPEHPDQDGARPPDPQLLHRRGRAAV